MRAKHFTLQEAESLLPRLRDLLPELQARKRSLDEMQARLADFGEKLSGNGHMSGGGDAALRRQVQEEADALEALLEQLNQLGCEIKDFDLGLVDFRTIRGGREVYLCWKLGEDSIQWWHDLESGFGGRRPLDEIEP